MPGTRASRLPPPEAGRGPAQDVLLLKSGALKDCMEAPTEWHRRGQECRSPREPTRGRRPGHPGWARTRGKGAVRYEAEPRPRHRRLLLCSRVPQRLKSAFNFLHGFINHFSTSCKPSGTPTLIFFCSFIRVALHGENYGFPIENVGNDSGRLKTSGMTAGLLWPLWHSRRSPLSFPPVLSVIPAGPLWHSRRAPLAFPPGLSVIPAGG